MALGEGAVPDSVVSDRSGGAEDYEVAAAPLLQTGPRALLMAVPLLLLLAAAVLWISSLPQVDLNRMGDLGLITILPPSFYAAVAAVVLSFSIAVVVPGQPRWLLLAPVALLVVIIHATPSILYPTVRYTWTYKHVGIVDYIIRHGTVDPSISYLNAYHDWPGFFALGAYLTQVVGFSSALRFAGWASPFFDLLTISVLVLIYRSLTEDRRLIWLAIWIYALGNWVGQDYFSPQAMCYFLYLVVLGIVLRWFALSPSTTGPPIGGDWIERLRRIATAPRAAPLPSQFRAWLMVVVIALLVVIAASHQLTPFMAISALIALVLVRVLAAPQLAVLMIALTVSWIVYMGAPFVNGNSHMLLASIGQLEGNVNAGLTPLAHVPPTQVFVAKVARGMTGLLLVLPILGLVRRWWTGHRDLAVLALTVSPTIWIAATRYGHEILFRVFLFALPFAAFLAAGMIFPTQRAGRPVFAGIAIAALSLALAAGLCVTYYGQEQMNYIAPDEVAAVKYFDRTAPAGALLIEGSANTPIPFEKYERFNYLAITDLPDRQRLKVIRHPARVLLRWMKGYPRGYFMVSRAQKAEVRITGDLPASALDRITAAVERSPQFKTVYRSRHAVIFTPVAGANGHA